MGLRGESFDIRVVISWKKLLEEVVEVGSLREFKGRLDNVWSSALGEGSSRAADFSGMVKVNAPH